VSAPRVGWLGGSFDPVHAGHLHIARGAAAALGLDRVLLVPANEPPHKRGRLLASGADRLALLHVACDGDPLLQPCDAELRRGGVSYSVDTARQLLAELAPGTELYAIVGADTLADLPNWRSVAELCTLVTFCPVAREGQGLDASPLEPLIGKAGVERIEGHVVRLPVHPASSTAVRAALAAGRVPEHLPPGVADEIARRGLYGLGGAASRESSGRDRSTP